MRPDPLLAAALGRAGKVLAAEAEYGAVQWKADGFRCYGREEEGTAVVTVVGPDAALVYEVVGVELAAL